MMTSMHLIGPEHLSVDNVGSLLAQHTHIALSQQTKERLAFCRNYLENKIKTSTSPIYGINTGFGYLYKKQIADDNLEQLQTNLVRSHACGMGDEVPSQVVKIMLLLKVQSLSYGNSGVREEVIQRLIDFYNHDILPVVYQQGSLGASGDLAPLAHICLPLLGEGEVYMNGKKTPSAQMLRTMGWEALHLKAKEGLALLNGTQFMAAYGTYILLKAKQLEALADVACAMSIDAFDGRIEAFDPLLHNIRPHHGQIATAGNIRKLLEGSQLISRPKTHVQDPYSFRCSPQVHGASKDTIKFALGVFETEINSVTDNPNIFPEEDKILSGGNFHGQPLALPLDFLAIALAELGSISERRIYHIIYGSRDLPDTLTAAPGLNSGMMIVQYTAASIVSQNKQLCTPASVDTIVSSSGQEDHVSMGANAATKCYTVMQNLEKLMAIEMMVACQALEFRRPAKSSPVLERIFESFRKEVSFAHEDRVFHYDMQNAVSFVQKTNWTDILK